MSIRLGVTMGDPLGIGPEVIQKALPKFQGRAEFKIFGLKTLLPKTGDFSIHDVSSMADAESQSPRWGGQVSVACLEQAMLAFRQGDIAGLVTAPISKHHVHLADFPFPGHTEFLAERTATKDFLMMMAGPKLRVSLVTIHEPIARVPQLLSVDKIFRTIVLTVNGLKQDFGITQPRVAVCGLNPHAGEEGLLGGEEKSLIGPAIARANAEGFACEGPKVPDAVFHEALSGKWDAVVCMYHDQGLIPFKMIHFQDGVNVTLGLPLVRTSPDHGTAFDIAGQGIADSRSMEAAIDLAIAMVERRQQGKVRL